MQRDQTVPSLPDFETSTALNSDELSSANQDNLEALDITDFANYIDSNHAISFCQLNLQPYDNIQQQNISIIRNIQRLNLQIQKLQRILNTLTGIKSMFEIINISYEVYIELITKIPTILNFLQENLSDLPNNYQDDINKFNFHFPPNSLDRHFWESIQFNQFQQEKYDLCLQKLQNINNQNQNTLNQEINDLLKQQKKENELQVTTMEKCMDIAVSKKHQLNAKLQKYKKQLEQNNPTLQKSLRHFKKR